MQTPSLSRLLTPRSVAIVGASPTPGSLGNSVLANLDRHGFDGQVHLINPKRDEIDGRPCLRSIDDLPMDVDAAVLAIPGPAVVATLRALVSRRVGAAIVFAAGFAEGGDEGMAAQREVARIAAESGMIVEGPNCLGMVNFVAGIPLTFVETPVRPLKSEPGIGIVSQSGAMAVVLGTMLMGKDLPLSLSVSTGNEAATGVEDYVEHLIGDPDTRVIGMIVEQFRDPGRFLGLVRRTREAGKPVVLLHPGRSSAARESAATHTGALAGDWQLMRCKVERAGVALVDSLEELGDVLEIAIRAKPIGAGGTAVLTESGAFKALTLDLADRIGLDLPAVPSPTASALRSTIPEFIPVSNPMDLTAQALVDPDLYRRTLAPLLAEDSFATVVLAIIQTDEATSERKFPAIIDAVAQLAPEKPVIFAGLDEGATVPKNYVRRLRELGVPYFPSPDRAFRAVKRLSELAGRDMIAAEGAPYRLEDLGPAGVLPEYRAKEVLAPAGIRFPRGRLAASLDEARAAAAELGFPVALKAQAAALPHKSDAGGVVLGVGDPHQLQAGWNQLHADVAANAPGISLDGVLVEAMGERGTELIIGARNDPDWGPAILVGFGGVQAELTRDVRLLPHDLTLDAIVRELRLLKSGTLFDGFRGSPPLDTEAVAAIVAMLGRILSGTPRVREIDLNPVVVYPRGRGATALDALIVVGD